MTSAGRPACNWRTRSISQSSSAPKSRMPFTMNTQKRKMMTPVSAPYVALYVPNCET